MPTFRVRSPDGKTYNVNAPEGTTAAQATAYVQKHVAAKPRTAKEQVIDFGQDVMDNIVPNWGDEIHGAGRKVGAVLGLNGYNPETAYEDGRAEFKRNQARYDKEHPGRAWGSTIVGTVAGVALPAGKAVKAAEGVQAVAHAAPKIARAVQASRVGAAYGIASGAGHGENLHERSVNAIEGGGVGATVGAILPSVGDGIVATGRAIRANVPGVDTAVNAIGNAGRRIIGLPAVPPSARPTAHADRMLNEKMHEGHIQTGMGQHGAPATPASIAAQVDHRASIGVPAMPADTTEAMRGVTSWASRGQGPGQTAVRTALNARKATEGARVRQHVVDTMGPAVDPIAAVQENLAASKVAAAPLYREAYELPTQITPAMADIMQTPAFRDAVPQAVRNIQNGMRNPRTMGFIPQPDGTFIAPAEGVLTTEGFDQVTRAMQDAARSAAEINPVTGAVNHNTNSVGINARAMDLRGELTSQNEPLRQAVDGYAEEAAHRQAMTAGGGIAKQTGHEINDLARQLPADAHPSYAQGARTALADQASTFGAKFPNGDTAANVTKSLGDDTKQAALEAIDGNRGAVPALQQRLEAEHQGNIVHKAVEGNSATAARQALDGEMDQAVSNLSSFSVRGVARSAIEFIANKASTPYRNAVKERIAQVVTETNPATVRELMAEIARHAETDREFAELMRKAGVFNAAAYGGKINPEAH